MIVNKEMVKGSSRRYQRRKSIIKKRSVGYSMIPENEEMKLSSKNKIYNKTKQSKQTKITQTEPNQNLTKQYNTNNHDKEKMKKKLRRCEAILFRIIKIYNGQSRKKTIQNNTEYYNNDALTLF